MEGEEEMTMATTSLELRESGCCLRRREGAGRGTVGQAGASVASVCTHEGVHSDCLDLLQTPPPTPPPGTPLCCTK